MRNLFNRINGRAVCLAAAILGALTLIGFFVKGRLASGAKAALTGSRGEGFVDTAIKILIAVVIGALVLGGLYALFNTTVIPTLVQRVRDMFNFTG